MGAVLVQARADLRSRPVQAVLLVLVVAVSAVLLSLGLTGVRVSGDAYDRLFRRTDGAHLWLYLDDAAVSPAEAEAALDRVPGVVARTPAMLDAPLGLVGISQPSFGSLAGREWRDDLPTGRVDVVRGRPPTAPGEVLLDRNVGAQVGLDVGDELPVATPGGTARLEIVGVGVTAEKCPYPMCNPTIVHVGPGGLAAMGLDPRHQATGAQIAIGARLADPDGVEAARDAAVGLLPPGAVEVVGDWRDTREFSGLVYAFQSAVLLVFSAVAMVVAGVLIAAAIGGAIRAETARIGMLKAVGFTGGQLRLLYLGEYLGPTVAAATLGTVMGALAAPALLATAAAPFGDGSVTPPLGLLVLVPVVLAAVAAVFVVLPVRRATRLDAVAAIRGTADGAGRPPGRRLAAVLARLPVPVGRGIADVRATPGRSVLIAAGLAVAALAMAFAVVAGGGMRAFLRDPEVGAQPDADLMLRRPASFPVDEAMAVARDHPDVVAVVAEHLGTFQFPDDPTPLLTRSRTGDVAAFRWPVLSGRAPAGPDEVLVGYGLARERGVGPGDRMTVLVDGHPADVRVSGVFRDMWDLGRTLVLSPERLPAHGLFPAPLLVQLADGADAEAVGEALSRASGRRFDPIVVDERLLPESVRAVRGVVARLLVVLAGLSALGVLSSVLLGVRERRRSLGLLKAVGMTPAQLTGSVLTGAAALGVAGAAVGIPVGVLATRVSLDAILRSLGFGPLVAPTDAAALALVVPAVVVIAAVGAWFPARQAGRVPVVETLRYE